MHELTAVENLNPGDYIDLENDEFADPFGFNGTERDPEDGSDEANHMYFECEYTIVEEVVEESEEVTALYSDQVNVGFPHGHKIRRYVPSDEDEQQWATETITNNERLRIANQPALFEVHVDGMTWADQDGVERFNRSDADELADRLESQGFDNGIQVVPVTE
jgi:1,4-alpha-glucan branching enzyme